MKVKTRVKLLLILIGVMAVSLFAGCKIGEMTVGEFIKDKNRSVTYYANGGYFDGMNSLYKKSLYYTADYPEVIVDFSKSKMTITRLNYIFVGWEKVALDEEGNPTFTAEDKNIAVSTGEPFTDTSYQLKENEHLYLCANWKPDSCLEICLVTEDGGSLSTKKDENGHINTFENLSVIDYRYYGTGTSVTVNDSSAPEIVADGYTFYGYYSDPECKTAVTKPIEKPASPDDENPKVYAKYIKGEWQMVRTASDVFNMMTSLGEGKSFYLMNDVDGSRLASFTVGSECNSVIEGNGYTISNLKYVVGTVTGGSSASIFGNLTANAKIRNVTFDTITGTVTQRNDMANLYLFASSAEAGAEITDVTLKNATFTIAKPADITINNIPYVDEAYKTDNWLCGGRGTDEAFLNEFSGLNIENATLNIGTRTSNATTVATYNATQTNQ